MEKQSDVDRNLMNRDAVPAGQSETRRHEQMSERIQFPFWV